MTTIEEEYEGPAREELIARAWALKEEGYTIRTVTAKMATHLGRPGLSTATVYRWVKIGQEQAPWMRLLEKAEAREEHAGLLALMREWLVEARRLGQVEPIPAIETMLKVLKREAELLGLDAPTRHAVTDDREPPEVDARVVAAIRTAAAQVAAEERALRAGEDPP